MAPLQAPAALRLLLVAVTTALTVAHAALLRADSAGSLPGPLAVTGLAAAVALALWALLARVRTGPVLLAGALLVQLAAQVVVQAGAVGVRGPWRDAACCPPATAPPDASLLGLLTADAGWLLLAVQLLVAAAVALSLRSVQVLVADTGRRVAAVARSCAPALRAVRLLLVATAVAPALPARPRLRPRAARPPLPLLLARPVTRRGPPRTAALRPSSVLPSPCAAVAL